MNAFKELYYVRGRVYGGGGAALILGERDLRTEHNSVTIRQESSDYLAIQLAKDSFMSSAAQLGSETIVTNGAAAHSRLRNRSLGNCHVSIKKRKKRKKSFLPTHHPTTKITRYHSSGRQLLTDLEREREKEGERASLYEWQGRIGREFMEIVKRNGIVKKTLILRVVGKGL